MIWWLYNIVCRRTGIVFGSSRCHRRLRISCGEPVETVFLREFGCNQKVFIVLISAWCAKIAVKIAINWFSCVVKVCFVGSAHDYGVFWWLSSILLQVFKQMCLLFYNTWINNKNKSLVWPYGVSRSIGITRFRITSLNQLKLFVIVHGLFLLAGWMPRLFEIPLLGTPLILLLREICNDKNQVSAGTNVM
jgi:hypothetical protein